MRPARYFFVIQLSNSRSSPKGGRAPAFFVRSRETAGASIEKSARYLSIGLEKSRINQYNPVFDS